MATTVSLADPDGRKKTHENDISGIIALAIRMVFSLALDDARYGVRGTSQTTSFAIRFILYIVSVTNVRNDGETHALTKVIGRLQLSGKMDRLRCSMGHERGDAGPRRRCQ